ncbi:MAG: hypothetical protein FRX49_00605 [Trebouxia sp. A1-2]|nr:MAG: hypothetical protein FRX49_00605 [Trebouxia sp. A1-2]
MLSFSGLPAPACSVAGSARPSVIAPLEEEVEALHSEGNVQRELVTVYTAPSMSHYLNQTAKVVLDKYKGDLDNLRKEAKHDPVKERELVKAFKGFGEVAVNIFCREAQEAWEELFPFADDRTLKLAAEHGLPDDAAKLAELVDNDKHKFVRLLAALIRSSLRKVPVDDEKGTVDSGQASSWSVVHACSHLHVSSGVLKKQKEEHEQYKKGTINTDKVELQKHEAVERTEEDAGEFLEGG